MFRHLQLKRQRPKMAPDPGTLTAAQLVADATLPVSIRSLNQLPPNPKQRLYRALLPPALLARLGVNPLTWKGPGGDVRVRLRAEPDSSVVSLAVLASGEPDDSAAYIELADNSLNGIDLNLLLLNDPASPRFRTDVTDDGQPTLFGTARRNLGEEERAMRAGLAPGQIRASLSASRQVMQQVDAFLALLGHQALFLEPLTYASAWVFERRGLAYVRGHKLMQDIHQAFQRGGPLHQALDGSTPFRQPEQWRTVRGRAWAIHDGVLEVLGANWNGLRMVKQLGREAGVNTFPDAEY